MTTKTHEEYDREFQRIDPEAWSVNSQATRPEDVVIRNSDGELESLDSLRVRVRAIVKTTHQRTEDPFDFRPTRTKDVRPAERR